jgi:hypothetical protein
MLLLLLLALLLLPLLRAAALLLRLCLPASLLSKCFFHVDISIRLTYPASLSPITVRLSVTDVACPVAWLGARRLQVSATCSDALPPTGALSPLTFPSRIGIGHLHLRRVMGVQKLRGSGDTQQRSRVPARPSLAAVPRGLTLSLRRAWARTGGGSGREGSGTGWPQRAHGGAMWWVTPVTTLVG